MLMNTQTFANIATQARRLHELRFASIHDPGRALVVPCDASGKVDLDSLSDRLRDAYLSARALTGREYLFPTVQLAH
jgi:hypothetical protein